jgi:copper chaperone CopZ
MPITLAVADMSCDGCEDIIETALEEVRGVESASADHEDGTAVVEGDPEIQDLLDAVEYAGYSAEESADASDTTAAESTAETDGDESEE